MSHAKDAILGIIIRIRVRKSYKTATALLRIGWS